MSIATVDDIAVHWENQTQEGELMKLTVGDIKVWNESLIGLIKELENLSSFATHAENPSLKEIFAEQLITHRQNYVGLQTLLDGASNLGRGTLSRYPSLVPPKGVSTPHLVLEPSTDKSSDRLLAYSHFLACCRGGREFAWNLFDVSYPPLAEILQHAVSHYARDAVTVKQWLLDHGHYLTEWATTEQIRSLQETFQ